MIDARDYVVLCLIKYTDHHSFKRSRYLLVRSEVWLTNDRCAIMVSRRALSYV